MNIVELPILGETEALEIQSVFVKAFRIETGANFHSRAFDTQDL